MGWVGGRVARVCPDTINVHKGLSNLFLYIDKFESSLWAFIIYTYKDVVSNNKCMHSR